MRVKIKLWKDGFEGETQEHIFIHIEKIGMDKDNYLTFYTNCARQMKVRFKVLVKVGLQAKLKYQHAGIYFDHISWSTI